MALIVPNQLTILNAAGFARQLFLVWGDDELVIDFRLLTFVEPFPTMILAHALRETIRVRARRGRKTTIIGIDGNTGALGYLKHLGFFRFVGVPVGKEVSQATPGVRFLPFTTVGRHQVMNKGRVMQASLESQAERLAKVIFPGDANGGPAMMLGYALREIMRNSFEHGGVENCLAMAQRWTDGSAEIAIADQGIGIYQSLAPVMKYKTPEDALKGALLPGISSQSTKAEGDWENSGFGLYVVSELGKRYGSFAILSSECVLHFESEAPRVLGVPLLGTMVKLRVNTRDADVFPNILTQIVAEGEEIAKGLPGAVKTASRMSKEPGGWRL